MIVYFGGPEGGGKSALMTRYCRIHHLMGGEVWAFPGYELKNDRGRVVSRLVMPEEIMGLLDEMQFVVLVVDEIQNFMNHHAWADKLVDIMTYGAAAQRRKRQFVILATGPIFEWLPSDLRMMFHEVIRCEDMHWKNHDIPRGQRIRFYREDKRGVLSGRVGTCTRPQIFFPSRYYKYYDTFSLIDPKYLHYKIKVKKDYVTVDSEGRLVPSKADLQLSDPASLDRYVKEYQQKDEMIEAPVREVIRKLQSNNITVVDSEVLYNALGGNKWVIGRILSKLGAKANLRKKTYDISEVAVC